MKYLLIALCCLAFLPGCGTGSGATWYNPMTWTSGSEARDVDDARDTLEQSERETVKAAQKTAHETVYAIAAAPASRPVDVAKESSGVTAQLLDQVAGPLTMEETQELRSMVEDLLSENAQIREAAESERERLRATTEEISAKLAAAQNDLRAKEAVLREAFARENELANKLRNVQFQKWAGVAGTLLMAGLAFYFRSQFGSVSAGIGEVLGRMGKAGKILSRPQLISMMDGVLNRSAQKAIGRKRAQWEHALEEPEPAEE